MLNKNYKIAIVLKLRKIINYNSKKCLYFMSKLLNK